MSRTAPRSDPDRPELVSIPAGDFVMGDVWADGLPDERPTREVAVESFLLGRCAVSCRQFVSFASDATRAIAERGGVVDVRRPSSPFAWSDGRYAWRDGCEDLPATCINWAAAIAYCEWLTGLIGAQVRLPTEIEWHYASLGPDRLKWALGNEFRREQYVCGCDRPRPVDWGQSSAWGLFNMTGNVFEWTADEYRFSLDQRAQTLPANRVLKGGAFILSDSANLRNSRRFSCDERSCLSSIGFRVAVSPGDREERSRTLE